MDPFLGIIYINMSYSIENTNLLKETQLMLQSILLGRNTTIESQLRLRLRLLCLSTGCCLLLRAGGRGGRGSLQCGQ